MKRNATVHLIPFLKYHLANSRWR